MTTTLHPKKWFLLSLMLGCLVTPALAVVNEIEGGSYNEGPSETWNAATGEVSNHLVLHQRVSERVLNTEKGIINIPKAAVIRDSRPVDTWYLPQAAKVTLVFVKDKMVRVEISN